MKKIIILSLLSVGLTAGAMNVQAANLWQVYQQASKSDPTFQAALASQMSVAEETPQARAVLLPQLSGGASATYSRLLTKSDNVLIGGISQGPSRSTVRSRVTDFGLTLKQNVFNFSNWMKLGEARDDVKAASATYNAASQDLMQRVASAYFAVLQAEDVLRATGAEKKAYWEEYVQAEQRFKVGVSTITDVDNAKAYYDTSIADYVQAENAVQNAQEDLRAITGESYDSLDTLKPVIPLVTPSPNFIDRWVDTALQQNWELVAARYTSMSAHNKVYEMRGGHLPTVDASLNYDNSLTRNYRNLGVTRNRGPTGEVDVSVPIFSGGMVTSQVRQALADYEKALQDQEAKSRQVIDSTRKSYLGVESSIATVKAQKQVTISNRSSLEGMEAGYHVGTRTMVDVLNAQRQLYDSEKDYAIARYTYANGIVGLKQSAGTLSANDIQEMNTWLISPQNDVQKASPPTKTVSLKKNKTITKKSTAISAKSQKNTAKKPVKTHRSIQYRKKTVGVKR